MYHAVVKQHRLLREASGGASIPFYDAAFMTTTANRAVIIVIIIAAITRREEKSERDKV